MESTVGQRLGFFLKCNGINQSDFASALKTSRTSVSAIISGARPISSGMIARIMDAYPQLNKNWLLNGVGEMKIEQRSYPDLVPHFPVKVAAGYLGGDSIPVNAEDVEYRERMKDFKMYDFTQDVAGDSMIPVFYDGDIVAARKIIDEKMLKPGKYYVVDTRNGSILKRLVSSTKSSILFASENINYPNVRIRKEDIFGMGEVVGSLQTDPVQARKHYEQQMIELFKHVIVLNQEKYDEPIDEVIRKLLFNKNLK